LSSTLLHPHAQRMVEEAVTQLHSACGTLLNRHRESGQDSALLASLTLAARGVSESMNQLLASAKQSGLATEDFSDLSAQGELLNQYCSVLMSQKAEAKEILAAYKGVATAATRMRSQAVLLAGRSNDELKEKLVGAARNLADQTTSLFKIVKETAENPKDFNLQYTLSREAGVLQTVAEEMVLEGSKQAAIMTLRHNAKLTCASSLALVSKTRLIPTSNDAARMNLIECAERCNAAISSLIGSINKTTADPFSLATQALLIAHGKELAGVDAQMVATIKRNAQSISDLSKKTDLLGCADMLQKVLKGLVLATEACDEFAGGKEAKEAMQGMDAMLADLDATEMAIGTGSTITTLHPGLPMSQLAAMMDESIHYLKGAKATLETTASANPEMMGSASLQYQRSLNGFTDLVKSMAALEKEKKIQREMIKELKTLISDSVGYVTSAKKVSVSPSDATLQQSMHGLGELIDGDADRVVDVCRSVDMGALDDAIKYVVSCAQRTKQDFNPTQDFAKYRGDVLEQMEAITSAVENMSVAIETNLRSIPQILPVLTHAINELITAVTGAAATVKDPESRPDLLRAGVQMATGVVFVLQAAKAVAGGGDTAQLNIARDRVNNSTILLTNAVNPGKLALEKALERVRSSLNSQDGEIQFTKTPLQDISEGARSLGTSTSNLLTSILDDPTQFARVAQDIAKATEDIMNSTRIAVDPGITEYSFNAKKMVDACDALLIENDFAKMGTLIRSVGLKAHDLINILKNDSTPMGLALKPSTKHVAASALDVYRQIQNIARRAPGAHDNLKTSVKRLIGLLEDLQKRSTSGKASNAELTSKLLSDTQDVVQISENLLVKSLHVSQTPKDTVALNELYRTANALSRGIQELLSCITGMAPGARETKEAIDKVQQSIQRLQILSLNAIGGKMERTSENRQACQARVISDSRGLTSEITKLVKNTIENQDLIGPSTASVAETLIQLVKAIEALAGTSNTPHQQAQTVDMAKGTADGVLQVMLAVRNAAANPYENDILEELTRSSQAVRNSVSEIVMSLQGHFEAQKECDAAISAVEKYISTLTLERSNIPYHVTKKKIDTAAIELLTSLNNLTQLSQNNPDQVGMASKDVADVVAPLIRSLNQAAGSTNLNGNEILRSAQESIQSVAEALKLSKEVAGDRQNHLLQQNLTQSMNRVTHLILRMQENVKQGDASERVLDEAMKKVRGVASSLESALLMSSAGQFEMTLDASKTLADYHTDLMKSAKQLRIACSEVYLNASSSIDSLAQSVTGMAEAMEGMSDAARKSAAMMSDSFSQQAVIHGTKAITIACQQLVLASKDANTRPNDPKVEKSLNTANKATDEAIEQLTSMAEKAAADILENVKRIEEAKGKITNGYAEFCQVSYTGNTSAHPRDIVISSRQLAKMSAQVVSSVGSSSEMAIESVEDIASAILALFRDSRGCCRLTGEPEVGEICFLFLFFPFLLCLK
jgi:hypothetical protein